MRPRALYLAYSLAALNVVGMLATVALANFIEGPSEALNLVTFVFFVLACAVVGALVASRRPANPLGWILSVVALMGVLAAIVTTYIEANPTPVASPGSVADWVGSFIWTLAFAPVIFVLQLFPTGRPLGPRWIPVLWLTAAGIGCAVVAYAFAPGPMTNSIDPVPNPFGIESLRDQLRVLSEVGGALIVASVLLAVVSLILRFRRSADTERQQLKWFAYAGMVVLGALAFQIAIFSVVPETDTLVDVSNALFSLTVTLIPVTIGIAMLRYRLYDIDRLISRTLAYGAVTAILAGGYLLGVLALQSLLPVNDDSPVIAASTLAVIATFGPLRTRIQTLVDSRFNRSRYDAQKTIDEFSADLRSQTDLDRLKGQLVDTVNSTMHPSHVSVWLSNQGTRR